MRDLAKTGEEIVNRHMDYLESSTDSCDVKSCPVTVFATAVAVAEACCTCGNAVTCGLTNSH